MLTSAVGATSIPEWPVFADRTLFDGFEIFATLFLKTASGITVRRPVV